MSVSFWLVVVFTIITWWPSKAKLYFICDYFFVLQIVALSNGTTSPIRSNARAPPFQSPHYPNHRFLAGCIKFWLFKAKEYPSLIF